MNSNRPIYIGITAFTIVKIILICVLFYLLYLVKDILAILFIALVLSSAFDPWVDWMQRKKIPRPAGILLIYLAIIIIMGTAITLVIPPIIEQVTDLSSRFPQVSQKLNAVIEVAKQYSQQEGFLQKLIQANKSYPEFMITIEGLFSKISGLFGGIITFVLVLVLTFYMTVEENAMKKIIWSIAPEKHQVYAMDLINRMQIKIGLWLRGQLILSFIIFTMIYIALSILGVKYALILALLSGVTEFVPYLGPIFAAIPAIIITFAQSGFALAIFTALIYYLVHLTESNIIVPKVMQKVVGLNPIISIAVLMIGFKLAGIVGAILSIPVATAASLFIKDVFSSKTTSEKKEENVEN
ncbi:MAG: AI-2E family transporter [Candidatus Falkowbacteria bacterium]|nr:AI-2E family transporter [Candidatus Falkowbacteria bacterium]